MELKYLSLTFRAENNLTQQEFADKLKVDRGVVVRMEQGKSIRPVIKRKVELFIEKNK